MCVAAWSTLPTLRAQPVTCSTIHTPRVHSRGARGPGFLWPTCVDDVDVVCPAPNHGHLQGQVHTRTVAPHVGTSHAQPPASSKVCPCLSCLAAHTCMLGGEGNLWSCVVVVVVVVGFSVCARPPDSSCCCLKRAIHFCCVLRLCLVLSLPRIE